MLFIFDMGGVVTNTATLERMYETLKMSDKDFEQICKYPSPNIFDQLSIGKISTEEFWNKFNNRIGVIQREEFDGILDVKQVYNFSSAFDIKKSPSITTDLFRLFFHPVLNEKTVELIKDLRKKHRVVCGTNTIQSHWENHMERGDYSYFDQTYASNKIGVMKPNIKYWQTIMDAEGFNPDETFFTDDKKENCDAAESLGIHSHQFIDADDLRSEWSKYL